MWLRQKRPWALRGAPCLVCQELNVRRELTEWPDRNHCASPADEETEFSASVKVSWLVTD